MATVPQHRAFVQIGTRITLELTEQEARALDAIFGYNVDVFLRVFYERMGKHYVQPHEDGVRSLHKTIRGVLSKPLSEVDKLRKSVVKTLEQQP
jgi:hypothetical protein